MGTTQIQKTITPLDKALDTGLIHDVAVKAALQEFWEWYSQRYTLPVDVELGDHLTLRIYHDATEEFDECVIECVEVAKKHAKATIDEDAATESCYDSCIYDVGGYFDAMFDEIRTRLFECLNKYGVKYKWEEGWEDEYRYLQVDILSAQ
jgi:hypothetical protein